jgi:hypothetical protein
VNPLLSFPLLLDIQFGSMGDPMPGNTFVVHRFISPL